MLRAVAWPHFVSHKSAGMQRRKHCELLPQALTIAVPACAETRRELLAQPVNTVVVVQKSNHAPRSGRPLSHGLLPRHTHTGRCLDSFLLNQATAVSWRSKSGMSGDCCEASSPQYNLKPAAFAAALYALTALPRELKRPVPRSVKRVRGSRASGPSMLSVGDTTPGSSPRRPHPGGHQITADLYRSYRDHHNRVIPRGRASCTSD